MKKIRRWRISQVLKRDTACGILQDLLKQRSEEREFHIYSKECFWQKKLKMLDDDFSLQFFVDRVLILREPIVWIFWTPLPIIRSSIWTLNLILYILNLGTNTFQCHYPANVSLTLNRLLWYTTVNLSLKNMHNHWVCIKNFLRTKDISDQQEMLQRRSQGEHFISLHFAFKHSSFAFFSFKFQSDS
jgi:hypothetical protein